MKLRANKTKADLVDIIAEAYFPERYRDDMPVVVSFKKRQLKMSKADLVELAGTARIVLDSRDIISNLGNVNL